MKTIRLLVTMMLLGITMGMSAQYVQNNKPSAVAKKQAKQYKKEGWKTAPGTLPLEYQLDRIYYMETQVSTDGSPMYAYGSSQSEGMYYDAAKTQADALAKGNLASNLHVEITRLVSTQIQNKHLPDGQVQTVTEITESSKSITIQQLNGVTPVLELFRTLKNGRTEVMIRCAYERAKAINTTMQYIDKECDRQGIDLGLMR